jgi:hypothetical protein
LGIHQGQQALETGSHWQRFDVLEQLIANLDKPVPGVE